jgi:hypothetical protein
MRNFAAKIGDACFTDVQSNLRENVGFLYGKGGKPTFAADAK